MTEPIKPNLPKRNRRWFQFSLRTLMIGVTLVAVACGYVAWQARIVAVRDAARARITALGGQWRLGGYIDYEESVPLIRRWLGDEPVSNVIIPDNVSKEDEQRIRDVFEDVVISRIISRRSQPK
jgi:hypothetical protein